MAGRFGGPGANLVGENERLSEELEQCKADKEFVWSLWKQLQKDSPDVAAAIDMAVTREKAKSEQKNQSVLAVLQSKDEEMLYLQASIEDKNEEISEQKARLARAECAKAQLERELEQQHREVEKQVNHTREALIECDELRHLVTHLETSKQQATTDKEELSREVLTLQKSLKERQQHFSLQEQQCQALQKELAEVSNRVSQLSVECSTHMERCGGLEQQLRLRDQLLAQAGELARARETDIKLLKDELKELRNSRDAWANHTTLQMASLQKLQTENAHLKADATSNERQLQTLSKQLSMYQDRDAHTTSNTTASPADGGARTHVPGAVDTVATHVPGAIDTPQVPGAVDTTQVPGAISVDARTQVPGAVDTVATHVPGAVDTTQVPVAISVDARTHVPGAVDTTQVPGAVDTTQVPGAIDAEVDFVGEVSPRCKQLLENLERELFESKAQLEAKMEELSYMRCAHDRRQQRIQALQASHKLVLQQLKTYETKSSTKAVRRMANKLPKKSTLDKDLQQETSEAVWNELAHYKERAKQADQQMWAVEEERDSLKTRCLRNQTTIAELRACLQHEKSDLERKICAIAEVESSLSSNSQEQRVADLELLVENLHREKREVLGQCRKAEKECYHLREKIVALQAEVMESEHAHKVKKLEKLSKFTMTDEYPHSPRDSISVTDSAVQVEIDVPSTFQKKEPIMKDAQLSPHFPWRPQLELSSFYSTNNTATDSLTDQKFHHRRTYSDGEILVHKVRARDALEKMYDLSRNLQSDFQSNNQQQEQPFSKHSVSVGTDLSPNVSQSSHICKPTEEKEGNDRPTKIIPAGTQSVKVHRCVDGTSLNKSLKHDELLVRKAAGSSSAGSHKCVWQQQVKSLQQRLKTLTKQVAVLSCFKQSFLTNIEKEKASAAQARAEAKETTSRLHGLKATIRTLQEEKLKFTENLKEMQSRHTCGSPTIERKEALKKLEAEKKALAENCHKLNTAVKSLQEQLQEKSRELGYVMDRCAKLERDTRQKRQVIEDQRVKLKQLKEESTNDERKIHSLLNESATVAEKVEQSKHKVELLRAQLKGQTTEKEKLMKMLDKCQEELANTIQQLSQYQESAERQKQLSARSLQEIKHHAELIQQEYSDTLSHLESDMKEKEKVIQEFQTFAMTLATEMEKDMLAKNQHHSALSSRVKEIAQSTLHLSELEIDEFFTDLEENPTLNKASFAVQIKSVLNWKPPFASKLVKRFMDFSRYHDHE